MKQCPKCGVMHDKNGLFCSRSHANSRNFSDESNKKKSAALKGRRVGASIVGYDKNAQIEKSKETWKRKRDSLSFDELSWDYKRSFIIDEQQCRCNKCGISEWFGKQISFEIDHIDGNNTNNSRDNLEALCPNCHSITDTWRGRNKRSTVSDDELTHALRISKNIRQALLLVGLSARGANYERAKRLLKLLDIEK